MTKQNGYYDWEDHPRWRELCDLSNEYERIKQKAEKLRELISKEVWGTQSD